MSITRSTDEALDQFLQAMPKAELHVHLEGSIRPETLLLLAERHPQHSQLPAADLEGLRRWFAFSDFTHFVQVYFVIADLLRTPDDFALAVTAHARQMAAENIRYSEMTFTPYIHTHLLDKGLSIRDLLAGLDAGRAQAAAEYGVEMRWIFDIPRNASFRGDGTYDPQPAEQTLAYALEGVAHGVVALGLGGDEVGAPAGAFAHAFDEAKAAGLLSIPHAGETRGAESVADALDLLQADRIGHGVRAIEDPALLTLLRDRQIPLEVNPTSNVCLHIYPSLAAHPFPHLDRMGLLLTVNSDDPPLFNTTLSDEYRALAREFGYGRPDLARIARNAFVASAAPEDHKARLLDEFDRWVAG